MRIGKIKCIYKKLQASNFRERKEYMKYHDSIDQPFSKLLDQINRTNSIHSNVCLGEIASSCRCGACVYADVVHNDGTTGNASDFDIQGVDSKAG